ncbi:MAG: divalent-cation tolerance protein CutA [Thermoproteota archaeon]|nr:MAG: divalent-cation tolerance protein CutA [Candidatus Korarchaeota archaeon]
MVVQVFISAGSREEAEKVARVLVERRLAACAQVVGPVRSFYWWKGRMEEADEWLCLAKSSREKLSELVRAVKEVHSYEVPEVIAAPVVGGLSSYIRWVEEELKGEEG